VLSIPCLAFLFGFPFEISGYNLAQRSLYDASSNLLSITEQLRSLRTGVLPFSEDYTECISLGSQTASSKKADIPDMNRLELKSVYFRYDETDETAPDDSAVLDCADTDGVASIEPEPDENLDCDEENESGWALQDFRFAFETGKVYSIVGRNGSGKSTLVRLLTKLCEPTDGQILANDVDIAPMSREAWLKQTAVVPQESSELWNFTIRDNIAFGCTDAALVDKEAELCGVTNFVEIDTYWGDKTTSKEIEGIEKQKWKLDFSGGERQSIALARGFCRSHSAKLFVLDEPSSALDPEREFDLFTRLRKEREGRITIFVTHSLKTCRASDEILVLSKGCLVQVGTHEELMKNEDGMYARLYNFQNQIVS
jgi:ABC-type multidrug transport system fused ATPase/permease subunit